MIELYDFGFYVYLEFNFFFAGKKKSNTNGYL